MPKPRRFGDSYKQGKPVDNHSAGYAGKVSVRKHVLEAMDGKAAVFDAFAGSGSMHKAVWAKAASYTGCDERFFFDKRTAYVGDNRIVMRSIDLKPYNTFDLDAYGSPWEQALIVARRRPVKKGERIGVVITEGSTIAVRFRRIPPALAEVAQISTKASGVSRSGKDVLNRAISGLCREMNCRLVKRWQAERKGGSRMTYIGLVLEGL
jgi:hypothetical protein